MKDKLFREAHAKVSAMINSEVHLGETIDHVQLAPDVFDDLERPAMFAAYPVRRVTGWKSGLMGVVYVEVAK